MNMLENIFRKVTVFMMSICIVSPITPASGNRDGTLDYQCRPRWDRFIVDETQTMWDVDSLLCYDKDGNKVDLSKLYGTAPMYGELNDDGTISLRVNPSAMYGTYTDYDPSKMYGKYDPSSPGVKKPAPKPQPVRAAAPKPVTPAVAQPKPVTTPKPMAPKPKPKPTPAPVIVAAAPVVVSEPAPVQKPKPKPKPAPQAQEIATSVSNPFDIDSYCTQINPPVMGPLPKGLVLMPGRPDQMSCVTK